MQEDKYSTISIKAVLKSGEVQYIKSGKLSRIYHFIQAVKSSDIEKYCLRTTYKTTIDIFDKKVLCINESEHTTKDELKEFIKYFTEK